MPPSVPLRLAPPVKSRVLARYRHERWKVRLFLRARWAWTPYHRIVAQLPDDGLVLDLGCGHGLLTLASVLGNARRRMVAVDHDEERLRMVRRATADLPQVETKLGDVCEFLHGVRGPVDGIVLMDVMHYFPFEQQMEFVRTAFDKLRPGGVLLVRDVDTAAGFRSYLNRQYERVMTGIGFTRAEQLHFRTRAEWLHLFARAAAFDVQSEPCGHFPFADVLFTCRKPAEAAALRRAA